MSDEYANTSRRDIERSGDCMEYAGELNQVLQIADVQRVLEEEIKLREQMRNHLSPFIKKTFQTVDPGATYSHNWHIDLISEYLEAAAQGDIRRLVINIAPRFMKSICVAVAFPAWLIGRNPSEQILSASYSQALSTKHSVDCRLVVKSNWFKNTFPDVALASDMNMKTEFVTTQRGHRIATSVGGTATGRGGGFLLVDDPVDPLRAMSDTERTTANDWFDQTYSTRLNNEKTGCIIIIMQRLHVDDLTGHVLKKGGWEHLRIPMEAERNEIFDFGRVKHTRKKGDMMHEERFGKKEAKNKKTELGSYGWAGQFQQRPSPLEGGMVNLSWFNRYGAIPKRENVIRVIQSWDTAQKAKEVNDPWGGGTWFETEKGYYLVDSINQRMTYPDGKRTVIGWFDKWQPDVLLIEDKSSGEALIQDLRVHPSRAFPVIAIQPDGDKVTRMSTASPIIEAGNCWLPERAPWLVDFEQEIANFPNSADKGQVDQTSQFLNWVKIPSIPTVTVL